MNKHILQVFILDKKKTDILNKLDIYEGNKCLGYWAIAKNCQLTKKQFYDYTQRIIFEDFGDYEPILFIYDDYYYKNTMYEILFNGYNSLTIEEIIGGLKNIVTENHL